MHLKSMAKLTLDLRPSRAVESSDSWSAMDRLHSAGPWRVPARQRKPAFHVNPDASPCKSATMGGESGNRSTHTGPEQQLHLAPPFLVVARCTTRSIQGQPT